jgi:dynamin 1-like protein
MKARLNTLMGQTQQELNAFGDATFLGEQHRVSGEIRHPRERADAIRAL